MSKAQAPNALIVIPSNREVTGELERLALPADAKVLLAQFADVAVKTGTVLIQAGRAILHFVLETLKLLPTTSFGVVIGTTLSVLINSIPIFGPLLSPLLAPLLLAFGIGLGAIADASDREFGERLRKLVNEFQELLSV